jgi:hypothetical protein
MRLSSLLLPHQGYSSRVNLLPKRRETFNRGQPWTLALLISALQTQIIPVIAVIKGKDTALTWRLPSDFISASQRLFVVVRRRRLLIAKIHLSLSDPVPRSEVFSGRVQVKGAQHTYHRLQVPVPQFWVLGRPLCHTNAPIILSALSKTTW